MFFFFMVVLLFLVSVAGAAIFSVMLRDQYIFGQLNLYIDKLQKFGEDSQEEYDFRANASPAVKDLCHLIRASRDDAKFKMRLSCAPKAKRAPKAGNGKVKK